MKFHNSVKQCGNSICEMAYFYIASMAVCYIIRWSLTADFQVMLHIECLSYVDTEVIDDEK